MVINGEELLRRAPIKDMLDDKYQAHGTSYGLAEVGYDIRIKQDIHYSPRNGGSLAINGEGVVRSETGRFCLASALEEFQMPSSLLGIVHDKSTWARRGLSVFNTVIEPGWCGFLTLELVFHGNTDVHIRAGSGIAQVVFHELLLPAVYDGKYQNQPNRPVEALS